MGRSLTPVGFWAMDMQIGEVISASKAEWLSLTSLKKFSKIRYSLYESDDGTFIAQLPGGLFIHFKLKGK